MTDVDRTQGPSGPDDAGPFEELGAATVPPGAGFGANREDEATPELLRREIESGHARLREVPGLPVVDGVVLRWWHRLARVLLVVQLSAGTIATERSGDAQQVADDLFVLGQSGGGGDLRLRLDERELLVRRELAEAGATDRLLARRRPTATAPAPRPPGATIPVLVDPPDVDGLLAGAPTPTWLRLRASRLAAHESSGARLAAAGCLARLWFLPTDAPVATEPIPIGDSGLRARIERWLRTLDARASAEVERSAVVEALAIQEEIERSPAAEATRAAFVRTIVDRRDDLESIRWSLTILQRGDRLGQALDALDAMAEERLAEFEGVLHDDEHLDAVSWQEVDAWWGRVGLSG